MIRLLAFGLLLLGFHPACTAVTWYTVELIAFQHLASDGLYQESWPNAPGQPSTQAALRLSSSGEVSPEEQAQGLYAFRLLDSSQLRLGSVAARLRRSEAYRPLLHVAWRQPGFSRSKARAVYVHSALPNPYRDNQTSAGGHAGAPELIGTLRLSRARYLHVDADLVHFRPDAGASPYRLRQSRRMRSKELHYIDHPSFGLLILVTPVETVEVFTDEPEEQQEQGSSGE